RDAVEFWRAHAPAAPQVAVDVAAHAVRRAAGARVDQHALVGELAAAVGNVVGKDLAVGDAPTLDDVEDLLGGREAQPVGSEHALGDYSGLQGVGIDPVDVGLDLGLGLVALVVGEDAEGRIGEPDRAIRLHHHVVGRVEPLAVEAVDQHRNGPVVLGARDAASAVRAADQAPLTVARVAVGEVGGLAVDADGTCLLLPLEDAIVGDIAPQQVTPVAEVDGTLRPAATGVEPLHAGKLQPVLLEARIERDDGGIGIARGLLPAVGKRGDGRGGGHGRTPQQSNKIVIPGLSSLAYA